MQARSRTTQAATRAGAILARGLLPELLLSKNTGGSKVDQKASNALQPVLDELARAVSARKCHACGCLASTLDTFDRSSLDLPELRAALADARKVLQPRKYDCLGCEVCFPAVAANALSQAFPDAMMDGALCPTESHPEREGWPPLPGEYTVLRYNASVAVCTLNDSNLAGQLAARGPAGLAIVGTMRTENLGIERVIRNVLANPNIRWLVLCGDDTRQLVGHLPGQSLASLFEHGVDEKRRIVSARGKRPFLKNVSPEHIRLFREQVQLVSLIGEQNAATVASAVEAAHRQGLPRLAGPGIDVAVETVSAKEPRFFKSDPAGFLVVYPDARAYKLVVEHYTNAGVLDCVIEGTTPAAVSMEVIQRGLVSQLDHAAYLGRELSNAERSLRTGEPYVQDRAPGEEQAMPPATAAGTCGPGCTSCH